MSIKRYDGSNWVDVEFARRYDGSNWVDVEFARRYDGSAWIDMLENKFLYKQGDEFTSKTGGWVALSYGKYATASADVFATKAADGLVSVDKSTSGYGGMCWTCLNALDLTKHSRIHVLLDVTNGGGTDVSIQLATSEKKHTAYIAEDNPLFTKWQSYPIVGVQQNLELTIDVSALTTGQYFYIIPYTYSLTSQMLEIKIKEVWLS